MLVLVLVHLSFQEYIIFYPDGNEMPYGYHTFLPPGTRDSLFLFLQKNTDCISPVLSVVFTLHLYITALL